MRKIALLFLLCLPSLSLANPTVCKRGDNVLPYNEGQVIEWLNSKSQKRLIDRAHVQGIIVRLIEDRQNHIHLEVDMDTDLNTKKDRVEIIFNTKFGSLPEFRPNDPIIACGDFIRDKYSPLKGVIHWLHLNPKNTRHEHGFLVINGVMTGHENPAKHKR